MRSDRIVRVFRGLSAATGTLGFVLGAAHAAGPAAAESAEPLAEVVVTGSRVRGEAPVGAAVTTLDRGAIEASPTVTVDRMLQELPQVFDLGISENSRGQPGGSGNIVYANSINLRGIGPNATLTLVDGHRATSNGRSVNPSILPTLGLERVEIVADGASAIYGSDAIAGVVNLIPRRSLDGGEGLARYGRSADGAFDEYQLGLAWGKVWDGGQLMLAFEHVFRSNLSGDERDFFADADQRSRGGNDYRVTACSPGTIIAGTTTYAIPVGGVTAANASSLVAGTANRCNSIHGQDLFPEQKYNSVNSTFTQRVNDWFTVFADGFFSKRDYLRRPADATATFTVPNTNPWFVQPPGFTDTSYRVAYSFADDLPNNVQSGYAQSWELTPGVRFKLPGDWRLEALVTYGRTHDEANTSVGLNTAALNAAAASSDPAAAFDPFGLHRTSASTLALLGNQIFFAPTLGRFTGYEARVDGALFGLPAGDVKIAAGYEGQQIKVDLGSARGAPTTPLLYRHYSRRVDSVYGELLVPLVGSSNALPLIRRLDLTVAGRYDKYDDVGNTSNPKFGLDWSPLDGVKLRASYGKSFRAPLIAEIYGNSNNLFQQNYQNPAGGPPIIGSALSGPNLDLAPETATTWSVGVDWEPLQDLRLSLTRFDVDYKNQVNGYLSDLTILTRAAQFAGTGIILQGAAARDRVLELLAAGVLPVGAFPGGSAANTTVFVDGRNTNLGRSVTTGYDFQLNYRLRTANAGGFAFNLGGTYLTKFATAITPAAPMIDKLNTIFNPLRFKGRAALAWDREPLGAQLAVNYVNGYSNTNVTPVQSVGSYAPVDLALSWNVAASFPDNGLASGLLLGFDLRNVFDEEPPYVNLAPNGNGSGGYDATIANPVGRQFALSLRKKW